MKLPERGFEKGFVTPRIDVVNLWQIDEIFQDGELVSVETLFAKGYLGSHTCGIKILATGELTKKVRIEAQEFSQAAKRKLDELKIEYAVV